VQFRRFLAESGHPEEVFWVFRDDIWQLSLTDARVKYPPPAENLILAQKVFEEGRERGLIEITAIATTKQKVAAAVWFPKYPNEEIQGWNRGMKLAISEPLPRAKVVGRLRWWLHWFLPRFRQFQRRAIFIGTKRWAAA
jgi:hypothetical protein